MTQCAAKALGGYLSFGAQQLHPVPAVQSGVRASRRRETPDALCPACGGRIEATQTRPRKEDRDGLEPETVDDDEEWADGMVEEYDF